MEEILDYPCSCGGKLKKSFCNVEFFSIDFGERACEVCNSCGSEFLDDATLGEIETEVKKRKIFGLERQIKVGKSGNSLVLRVPPEIAAFTNTTVDKMVRIFPISKNKIEIELL
ncbi:hypothetical protein HZA96_03280 [Candidatus Woesearchaeota archaeon]|nr:hypothetical protein [Candidatus Woesearchaeota archaeon]